MQLLRTVSASVTRLRVSEAREGAAERVAAAATQEPGTRFPLARGRRWWPSGARARPADISPPCPARRCPAGAAARAGWRPRGKEEAPSRARRTAALALSAAPMAASARSSATASPIRPTSARRGPSAARVIGASRGSRAQALTSGEQTACPDNNERATCGRARVRRHRGRAAGLGGAVRPLSLPALLGGTAV